VKKITLFEYKSYKAYLLDWIANSPANGRGQRKLLAQAVSCQTPFVTQVLTGDYNFSLEQAEACGRWLGFGRAESEYFLLLVIKERAGTKSLAAMIERQLAEKKEKESQLTNRLKISETLTNEDQVLYYSSWQYAAVHMALLNPNLRTLDELNSYFELPLTRLIAVLDFLVTKKLAKVRAGRYEVLKPVLHLGRDSPLLAKHHANWRLRAIESIESSNHENFHYSGVISVSADDFEWIKSRLADVLEEAIQRLKNSKDERIGCLALDLFGI